MSDTPTERNSNSKSNLIEVVQVQHVGVTAKLQSPLKNFLQTSSSSTETENGKVCYQLPTNGKTKYNKFTNDSHAESEDPNTTTDMSKILYEMRTIRSDKPAHNRIGKSTPTKIEFQLYNRPAKRLRRNKTNNLAGGVKVRRQTQASKRKLFNIDNVTNGKDDAVPESNLFQRLRQSLDGMRLPKTVKTNFKLFDDLPEPTPTMPLPSPLPPTVQDTHIGIYPFEHGCADYLRTTDCHPQLLSMVLAERATHFATRFWAEFFGSLHIGVAFVVTFMLQCYRFILYSLINTLLVGFLHMTSDYLVKPVLTVLFNGFLQPPLIFTYNILSSLRDILEPIADAINNFMKPIATVGKSLRLIHATYNSNSRKLAKEV